MEYIYATLTLNELDQELNQENITAVLEAAGADVIESRVKAIVAALEDVDLEGLEFDAPAMQAAAGGDALETVEATEAIGYTDIDDEADAGDDEDDSLGELFDPDEGPDSLLEEEPDDEDAETESDAESTDEDTADGEEASPDGKEDQ